MNETKRNISKNLNLFPNVRPIYNPARAIKNNLFPKNHIIYKNDNYNIKVNLINRKKEKIKIIIEGYLNFYEASKSQKLSGVRIFIVSDIEFILKSVLFNNLKFPNELVK